MHPDQSAPNPGASKQGASLHSLDEKVVISIWEITTQHVIIPDKTKGLLCEAMLATQRKALQHPESGAAKRDAFRHSLDVKVVISILETTT
ncbi:hypothetical protein B5F76_06190, partial [Desulfovibrio sp. An276]